MNCFVKDLSANIDMTNLQPYNLLKKLVQIVDNLAMMHEISQSEGKFNASLDLDFRFIISETVF